MLYLNKSFKSKFSLPHSIDEVFPLLSPEGEKLWVPNWDYQQVTQFENLCENFVFLTEQHGHAQSNAIWIVKEYQPETYHVEFYKIEPENKISHIIINGWTDSIAHSCINVQYNFIGLSDRGNEFIENCSNESYRQFICEWEKLLLSHLKTKYNSSQADDIE